MSERILRPCMCPLCDGEGAVSHEVMEALKVGKALGGMNRVDFEKLAERLSAIIGDQVADVLSDYHVALVRNTEL